MLNRTKLFCIKDQHMELVKTVTKNSFRCRSKHESRYVGIAIRLEH